MKIITKLQTLSQGTGYWMSYVVGGLLLLTVALFYQYGLDELPCVVCIQIRLWITWLVITGFIGFLVKQKRVLNITMQLSLIIGTLGFVERCYLLLGTEKGFIFGGCGFDTGLPAWFAIEQWMPWIYKVETSCGYTPELVFGVTMAESLMVLSVGLVVVSLVVGVTTLFNKKS